MTIFKFRELHITIQDHVNISPVNENTSIFILVFFFNFLISFFHSWKRTKFFSSKLFNWFASILRNRAILCNEFWILMWLINLFNFIRAMPNWNEWICILSTYIFLLIFVTQFLRSVSSWLPKRLWPWWRLYQIISLSIGLNHRLRMFWQLTKIYLDFIF